MGKRATAAAVDSDIPSSGTTKVQENLMVPFNLIVPDPEFNSRKTYEKIPELSESIFIRHITPLTVTKNPDGTFSLVSGYRRQRAMVMLVEGGRWEADRLVAITLESYESDAALYIANLVENVREDPDPIDLGHRLSELELGTYRPMLRPLVEGEEPTVGEKVSRKEIARRTGMTVGHIANLIRVARNIAPGVQKLCRKNNVPINRMIAWATITEEVVDEETGKKAVVPDEAKQEAVFGDWKYKQDQEKEEGKPNKAKKGKKKKAKKKDPDAPEPVSMSEIRDQQAKLEAKIKEDSLEGEALVVAKAKDRALRWVLGLISKLG